MCRNKLAADHERQRVCLEEKAERKRIKIVQDHETRLATMQLAVENIERKSGVQQESSFSAKDKTKTESIGEQYQT